VVKLRDPADGPAPAQYPAGIDLAAAPAPAAAKAGPQPVPPATETRHERDRAPAGPSMMPIAVLGVLLVLGVVAIAGLLVVGLVVLLPRFSAPAATQVASGGTPTQAAPVFVAAPSTPEALPPAATQAPAPTGTPTGQPGVGAIAIVDQRFADPLPTVADVPTPAASAIPPGTLEYVHADDFTGFPIHGVMLGEAPLILVQGRERGVGDSVAGFVIKKIGAEAIEVEKDGRRFSIAY